MSVLEERPLSRAVERKPGVREGSTVPSAFSVLVITFTAEHATFHRVVIFQPRVSFALSIADSFVLWLI